jgi:hypothetical protein
MIKVIVEFWPAKANQLTFLIIKCYTVQPEEAKETYDAGFSGRN